MQRSIIPLEANPREVPLGTSVALGLQTEELDRRSNFGMNDEYPRNPRPRHESPDVIRASIITLKGTYSQNVLVLPASLPVLLFLALYLVYLRLG